MSDLRELYQQVILDHNKNPRNFHEMPDATVRVEGYNPLCGDHYTIFVQLDDEKIREVSFTGSGCAISKASASVMSSTVKGKSKEEAEHLFDTFHKLVTGDMSGCGNVDGRACSTGLYSSRAASCQSVKSCLELMPSARSTPSSTPTTPDARK